MVVPANLKKLQNRSRDLRVRRVDQGTYVVESNSNPAANHIVTVAFGDDGKTVQARCTCRWAMYHGVACTHVLATLEYMASQKARTLSFWESEADARRQKHRRFALTNGRGESAVWITSRSA